MKLSSMNTHYRYYSLEEYCRTISKLGFDACEIWTSPHHFNVTSYESDDVGKLKELVDNYNLKIICICPEQTNPKPHNIATSNEKQKERVFQYFTKMIDISKVVGANKVVVTSGWAFYDEKKEDAYQRSVKMMKRISRYALEIGVCLALEALQPDESILVNTIDDIKKYREDVDCEALKVCIDMGAMARANETLDMYFNAFGEDVIHIHFVDGNPTGHLAWGDGTRDIDKDIRDIKKYGYQGYLSLENATSRYYEKPAQADEKSIKQYLENGGE